MIHLGAELSVEASNVAFVKRTSPNYKPCLVHPIPYGLYLGVSKHIVYHLFPSLSMSLTPLVEHWAYNTKVVS